MCNAKSWTDFPSLTRRATMATLGDSSMPYRNFIPRAAVAVAAFLLGGAILVNKLGRFAPGRAAAAQASYDYSVAYESPELSCSSPLSRPDFPRYEDYTEVRFIHK